MRYGRQEACAPDLRSRPTLRRAWLRWLGWGLRVVFIALCGWSEWRENDYRAAVRAAGFNYREIRTLFARICANSRAAFRLATWTETESHSLPAGSLSMQFRFSTKGDPYSPEITLARMRRPWTTGGWFS